VSGLAGGDLAVRATLLRFHSTVAARRGPPVAFFDVALVTRHDLLGDSLRPRE